MSKKKFARNKCTYLAHYDKDSRLIQLINETTGEEIPANTQTFRRLADGNRGDRLSEMTA